MQRATCQQLECDLLSQLKKPTPLAVTQPELLTPLLPPPLSLFRRLALSVCHLLSWPQPPGRLARSPHTLARSSSDFARFGHIRNCHSARVAVCRSSMTTALHTEPLPPSPQSSATTSPGCRLWLLSAKMRPLSAAHLESPRLPQRPLQRWLLGPAKLCNTLRPKRRSSTHHEVIKSKPITCQKQRASWSAICCCSYRNPPHVQSSKAQELLAVTQAEQLTPLLPPPLWLFRRLAWSVCHLLSWPQPPGRLARSPHSSANSNTDFARFGHIPATATQPAALACTTPY